MQGADDPDLMSQPIPSASVNYHRRKLASNDYLPKTFRAQPPKPLDIMQPKVRIIHALPVYTDVHNDLHERRNRRNLHLLSRKQLCPHVRLSIEKVRYFWSVFGG